MEYFQDRKPICLKSDVENMLQDLTHRGYTAHDLRTRPQGGILDVREWKQWADGIFDLIWVHKDAMKLF